MSSETMSDPFASDPAPADSGLGVEVADFDPRRHRDFVEMARERPNARDMAMAQFEFRPMADLPVPDKHPGFVYRYIRVAAQSEADTRNVARKMAEGWVPVSAVEQPRIAALLGKVGVNTDGNIEVGGLMLCKLPVEIKKARERYYSRVAEDQLRAVDARYLRDQNGRMPKLAPERSSHMSNSR